MLFCHVATDDITQFLIFVCIVRNVHSNNKNTGDSDNSMNGRSCPSSRYVYRGPVLFHFLSFFDTDGFLMSIQP